MDVDALTFGTRYRVNFDGGDLYFPVEAGTWTKIQTDQWAACEDDSALDVVCHID